MKSKILLSGSHLARDHRLIELLLEERMEVTLLSDTRRLDASVEIVLVIMELSDAWEDELALMSSLKADNPQLLFIAVNGGGDQKVVINSFRSGASDFFKKPYNVDLLAERATALIKAKGVKDNKNV